MRQNTNLRNSPANLNKKSFVKNSKVKNETDKQKLIKCKYCHNYQTKTTLNFSCNHNLCGICVARLLIENDFKSLSEKQTIELFCSICRRGQVETSLVDLEKILGETFQLREEPKKDICEVHNKIAENYCLECKKWICLDCMKLFHNSYFKGHTLVLEEPLELKKCKEHTDKVLDLFCKDCHKEVCHLCSREGENHEGHKIVTLREYRNFILKNKRKYQFKSFDDFDDFLKKIENEFRQKFENSFKIKEKIINEIIELFQKITEDYFPKKQEKLNFIENYFKIIRGCYFNYFTDLKIKEPTINTLNFISRINKELIDINFSSEYTKELEKIKESTKLINPKKFFKYNIKFLHHSLNCIKTIKEEPDNRIYCITQLKNGNIVTGGTKGVLNVWDINTLKKVDYFKAHDKLIYSVIQLNDGRLVSASADLWIKFFDFENVTQPEPKKFDIIDQNKLIEKNKKKEIKKKKPQNNDNETIILRGHQQKKVPNNNSDNNMNNNMNNNINNNMNDTTKLNDMNQNSNINSQINSNLINTNVNNNNNNSNIINNNIIQNNLNNTNQLSDPSFTNYKPNNMIIPNTNNQISGFNPNMGFSNAVNAGLSNQIQLSQAQQAPDVSYSGGGVHSVLPPKPQDVPHGGSGQSNIINNNLDVGYSGNGIINPLPQNPPDVSYSGSNNMKVPDVAYSAGGNATILQKQPDVSYGDSNINIVNKNTGIGINAPDVSYSGGGIASPINNNINMNNNVNNNTINSINTTINLNTTNLGQNLNNNTNMSFIEPEKKKIKDLKESDFDIPEESNNSNIGSEGSKKKKIKDLKESDIDLPEDIKNEIHPANPPKNNKDTAYNSDNEKIIINQNGSETCIDSNKNRCLIALRGHYDDVFCILETSKKQLVSCSKDGSILIWDIDNHSVIYNFKGHNNSVGCCIEFCENKIVTGGADCVIKIWDISTNPEGKEEVLKGHKNAVFSICKIDENKIASSSCDKTIRLWDLTQKKCICIFDGHLEYVWSVVKIKDENKIASSSSDKTIKIWDIEEKKCINTIQAHNKDVTVLSSLSDGKLVSGSLDMKMKIWEC